MRVVHVSCVRDPHGRTGAELLDAWPTLGDVAAAVSRAGAEVTVLQSAHADGDHERDGVRYRFVAEPRLPGRRWRTGAAPWRLARAAAALRPDVIHLNGLGFPLHARALCGVGAPVLAQDHANAPPRRFAALHRWGLARVGGVAFTAREQAEPFFRARLLRPGTPVFTIPESSTHFTPGDVTQARATTGVDGDPGILWVGRLNDNKDPLTILDAFSLALPRMPGARLWCCYHEAPLLDAVRARLAAEPALAERVHLLGAVPHPQVELLCRAADLFVLGSRREAAGYAVLEAIACGAAPVLSDIPPFRALTGGGAVGARAAPGDAAAFADALVALAAEPRDALRARTAAHFRRELSFDVVGARLVEAYEALVAGGRTSIHATAAVAP
ncbi:MAG TPA: glycosyltransferase family 4 protein [Longimicrobium sp.]|nr:glycosyltransferase family 4 protein [Longimicrobium sp.]